MTKERQLTGRAIITVLVSLFAMCNGLVSAEAMQSQLGSTSLTIDSYQGMRGLSGSEGQALKLLQGTIGVAFTFRAKVKGAGDDGATLIKAKNGWWQREFEYGQEHPILLDWFGLKQADDMTSLIMRLAQNYAPNLYLKLPHQVSELSMKTIDLSEFGVVSFYLYEPDNPIIIQQLADSKNRNVMLKMSDYQHVYVGGEQLNVTFRGLHKGVRGGHNAKLFGQKPDGLLSFNRKRRFKDNTFEFRANIEDSRAYGLDHRGNPSGHNRTPSVVVAGRFLNSGLRFNGGHEQVYLDNVWLSDPYAVALGWDGSQKKNNGTKSGMPYYERSRGVSVVYADSLVGSANLEFGRPRWFLSTVKSVGEGEDKPFVVRYKDLGYTATGVKVSSRGFLDTGGKVDSLGVGQQRHFYFEELSHEFGYGLRHSIILEATSQDGDGGAQYFNQGVHLKLNGISKNVKTAHIDYLGDFSSHHTVTGTMASCDRRNGSLPIQPRLVIHRDDFVSDFVGCVIEFNFNTKIRVAAENNTLDNIRIVDGGYLLVGEGAKNNTVRNASFIGSPRSIIKIMNVNKWSQATISLKLENINAPPGSQIVAAGDGDYVISLDGESIELPYTIY